MFRSGLTWKRSFLLGAAVAALTIIAFVGQAQWGGWQSNGCYECLDDNPGAPFPDVECSQVGNNRHGRSKCREGTVGGFGKVCQTDGVGCFNVNSGGSGGGGVFDDDPSGCTISAGSICPASCASCTVE